MKTAQRKGRMRKLFRQLFTRKLKANSVTVYLPRFETIEKLIDGGILAIDLERRYVCIDTSLHIQYMESEKRYAAFFDSIRAYINFCLGQLQKLMLEPEDRIDFGVMLRQTVMYDHETEEFYDPPRITYHTLLVGANQYGKVFYEIYKPTNKVKTEETESSDKIG